MLQMMVRYRWTSCLTEIRICDEALDKRVDHTITDEELANAADGPKACVEQTLEHMRKAWVASGGRDFEIVEVASLSQKYGAASIGTDLYIKYR